MNRNIRSMLGDVSRTLQDGSSATPCVSSRKFVFVFLYVLVVGAVLGLSGVFAAALHAQERPPELLATDVSDGNVVTDLSSALAKIGSRQATLNVAESVAVSANSFRCNFNVANPHSSQNIAVSTIGVTNDSPANTIAAANSIAGVQITAVPDNTNNWVTVRAQPVTTGVNNAAVMLKAKVTSIWNGGYRDTLMIEPL